ncbi:MAG: dockerin type I repeat-containing protein, partial [Oscillospiraceae bacterium]|nr:dockerin type I repeat-containing protein [Candidatus Ruminococcus equi]
LYLNNFNQKTMLTIMDGENAPNDMSIGISMQKTPSDSNPIPVSDATMKNAYLACFFSDNNNYSLSIMDDILYMTNEHTYIYGDVDHDGEITIIDVTIIQRYLAFFDDKLTDEDLLCCDADGNGKISILDCTHIQRYISKLSCSDNVGKHFTI